MAPKVSAKGPSGGSKLEQPGMCLMEKIHVLDKLSGTSYGSIGGKFNATREVPKVSLNRNSHKTRLYYIDRLVKTWPEVHSLYLPRSSGSAFINPAMIL